jgi:hypothetical protein
MKTVRNIGAALVSCLLLLCLIPSSVPAQKGSPAATVTYTEGYADVKRAGTDSFVPLVEGAAVEVGDTVETGDEGRVELTLADKSALVVGPDSRVVIKALGIVEVTKASTSVFELISGKIRAVVRPFLHKDSRFTVETTNATVGVRGTDFGVVFDPDKGSTYVLGLDGCVAVDAKPAPGVPIDVCGGKELSVVGGTPPVGSTDADEETLKKFLEEMRLSRETGGAPAGAQPPFIASAFLNRTINLEDIEEPLTLTRDMLTIDGTIVVTGTAGDDQNRVARVALSLDGGMTWRDAAGTSAFSYEFIPAEGIEYELMIKAISDIGIESDPRDLGPWTITFEDKGAEEIVRDFMAGFVGALRSEDISTIRDMVSERYDGSVGGYFSKDELVDEGIRDSLSAMDVSTISYSVDQVNVMGDRIVGVTRWTGSFLGTKETGTTRWWLAAADGYLLVHTEGDWLFAGVDMDAIILPEGLSLEEIDSGRPYPCHKGVRILLTLPALAETYSSVTVDCATFCPAMPTNVTLTRSFYKSYTRTNRGFGAEVTVEYAPPCAPSCSPMVFYDSMAAYQNFYCSFMSYGYILGELVILTP